MTAAATGADAPLHPAHRRRAAGPLGPRLAAHRADEDPRRSPACRTRSARSRRSRQLIDAAHAVGAVVVVDAAQLAPHHRDRRARRSTATSWRSAGTRCSARRRRGGLLRRGRAPRRDGADVRRRRDDPRGLPRPLTWNDVPYKFEAGTMQIAQQVGLGAAVDYLEALGMDAVRAHEEEITRYALDRLLEAGAHGLRARRTPRIRGGAVSFWYKDVHPHDLAHDPERGGRRDPCRAPLRAARDAAVRHARDGAGLVLRLQHQGRGRRAGRRARQGRATSSRSRLRATRGNHVALDDIYKEVILDHYKSPRNKRELPEAELYVHAQQPAVRRRDHGVRATWRATRSPRSRSRARAARSPSRAPR